MNLYDCDFNKNLKIINIYLHGQKKRMLYNIGFVKNKIISKVSNSLYKDKICININGRLIVIKSSIAYDIEVIYAE